MKNHARLLLCLFLYLLSCSKDHSPTTESIRPTKEIIASIKNYLSETKLSLDASGKTRLDTVIAKMVWNNAEIVLNTNNLTIISIPTTAKTVSVLFYSSNSRSKIDSSLILLSNIDNLQNVNKAVVFTDLFQGASTILLKSNFSISDGNIRVYSVDNQFKYETGFKSNKVVYKKEILQKKRSNQKGTIVSNTTCFDYYWVTTYTDGSQTWSYLYTVCDPCDQIFNIIDLEKAQNKVIKSQCAGGGGGGGVFHTPPDQPACGLSIDEATGILDGASTGTVNGTILYSSNGPIEVDQINGKIRAPMLVSKECLRINLNVVPPIVYVATFGGIKYKNTSSSYEYWKWEQLSFSGLETVDVFPPCTTADVGSTVSPVVISGDGYSANAVVSASATLKISCVGGWSVKTFRETNTFLISAN